MHMAPHVTRALLIQCTCEWHAGLLHNDGSDSITVHGGVILHTLMIPNAAWRHSKLAEVDFSPPMFTYSSVNKDIVFKKRKGKEIAFH